jgi:hypothetical protein
MGLNRGLKNGGLNNLKLEKQVGNFLTEARWSYSRLPGRVSGNYDSKPLRIRNGRCTHVTGEAELVVDTHNTYNCELC